jgi:L-ascorbate 6-phosphate lactonase
MTPLTMETVRRHKVPTGSMTLWWLGQTGFLIKSPGDQIIALDPYLTNSCKAIGDQYGFDMDRLVPAPISPRDLVGIDLYVLTHSHQDHLDPETLEAYRAAGGHGPFLGPPETVEKLHALGVPQELTHMIWPNKSFTLGDMTLRATLSIPTGGDDLTHIGYLISVEGGPRFYFTGDTAYHEILGQSVSEHKPDVVATVINGGFRNLGPAEAAQMTKAINPKVAIPCHHDLFADNSLSPKMFKANLRILGIDEKYRLLEHGKAWTFPET